MEFIIVGYGRVGQPTVRKLDEAGHDVVVVETNPEKVSTIESHGLQVVDGDGASEDVLEAAGLPTADGLAALTGDLDTNVAACESATSAGCRTVLRMTKEVSDSDYTRYSEQFDEIVYPERFGAAAAKTALLGGDFNVISSLTEDLSIASVSVTESAPVIGQRVVSIDLPGESRIYGHGREGDDLTIPLPQTTFEPGDSVAIMADTDLLPDVRAAIQGA